MYTTGNSLPQHSTPVQETVSMPMAMDSMMMSMEMALSIQSDFYQYNGNLTVFDIGANSITFDGTSSITLSRCASSDPNTAQYYMYETIGGMDASLMPDNAFYDLNITSGSLAGLTVAQLLSL